MPRLFLAAALLLSLATPALARSSQDHASVGGNIVVAEGETAGDIACAFCSVQVHGDVKGDVAILFGSLTIDSTHTVSGDVAILGGDLNLGNEAEIGGDLALAGGDPHIAPEAMVHGSRAIFPSRLWVLIPFAPFLIFIGIIWLIVYLVRRNRYRYPAYPNGRGF
ncbi:MAG TPA: hypothetical protein VK627_08635 [Edaphobacter sp.]|nr:hypothetical protein [Edaphobacter sp.]